MFVPEQLGAQFVRQILHEDRALKAEHLQLSVQMYHDFLRRQCIRDEVPTFSITSCDEDEENPQRLNATDPDQSGS